MEGLPTREHEFQVVVEYFIRACPGPPPAEQGLRMVAYQRVPGIVGLEDRTSSALGVSDVSGEREGYFHSVEAVGARLEVRPAHLSQSALRRGYSYSTALRWIRFLHGQALRAGGATPLQAVWRIGFSDPSGWTRFVRALVGKGPRELPRVPLGFWGLRAVEDVYLGGRVVSGRSDGADCGGNDKQTR